MWYTYLLTFLGGGSEFQLRGQHGVRLGLDLPDYIPLPSTDVRPSCCDVLSTTSGHNVDDLPGSSSPEDGASDPAARRLAMTGEILRQLRVIVARMEATGRQSGVVDEWRQIAVVIDRCLFRLFLATTVVGSVIVLVLVPLYSRPR